MVENSFTQQDYLTISEFACVFAHFFLSYERNETDDRLSFSTGDPSSLKKLTGKMDMSGTFKSMQQMRDSVLAENLSISQIAIATMQNVLWRGTNDQVSKFIQKVCTGRSKKVVELVVNIRNKFEEFDRQEYGEISVEDLKKVLLLTSNFKNQVAVGTIYESLKEHVNQQGRNTGSVHFMQYILNIVS